MPGTFSDFFYFYIICIKCQDLIIKPKNKKYAIVGLPCQIVALRKYYKKYENKIFFISLMCNQVPSKRFTDFIYERFKVDKKEKIKYRGNGLPGDISIGNKVRLPLRKTFRMFNKYFYNWRCIFFKGKTNG